MLDPKEHKPKEEIQSGVNEPVTAYGISSTERVFAWLQHHLESMARLQTLDDIKNSIKNKGNKYGDYTQQAIEATYNIRKQHKE